MTRINVVPVEELCDQHLLAEWRELPRMAGFVSRCVDPSAPSDYTLGTGHMKFFLDKGEFLEARHAALTSELLHRGFSLKDTRKFKHNDKFGRTNYQPTPEAIQINRARIAERMPASPRFNKGA